MATNPNTPLASFGAAEGKEPPKQADQPIERKETHPRNPKQSAEIQNDLQGIERSACGRRQQPGKIGVDQPINKAKSALDVRRC